jgi:4-diphosphocytidyl-2-C-methyl-D-erythritol kinase
VKIRVEKRVPAGSGLGGGSSDAATTLLALNRLWQLDWPRARLAGIGGRLGADVPFFLQRSHAFGEGTGERLTPIELPPLSVLLVHPNVHVSTVEIFNAPELTRDTKPTKISSFSAAASEIARIPFGINDLEAVVRGRVAAVDAALGLVQQVVGKMAGYARMTGSGSAVFALFAGAHEAAQAAERVGAQAPSDWSVRVAPTLGEHPLAAW